MAFSSRRRDPSVYAWSLALGLGLILLGACGGSDDDGVVTVDAGVGNEGAYVGGSCTDSDECDDFCILDSDYPGGMCSTSCDSDTDCPAQTACIDDEGGVCMLLCDFDEDCRRDYYCEEASRRGHQGNATVCIGDD